MKLKNISNIKWIGGKHGKEDIYIDLMPKHRIYCDCTFGSGAVTFAKEFVRPAEFMTIVNDKNDKLINFLLQLKDHPEELIRELDALPWSETLYNRFKWESMPEDPLEQAVRFFYIMRLTFSGGGHKYKNGLGMSKAQDKCRTFRNSICLLEGMSSIIKSWNILCRDMFDIIDFYDGPDTFFFIDPPYDGYEEIYFGGWKPEDHSRLRERLATIQGKAMVCYYPSPLIDRLYDGWERFEYNTASQLEVREEGEQCPVRTELVLMNYQPPAQSGQVSFFERGIS